MPTRAEIIKEADTWLDTPFIHQGRSKGIGVDCAGLIYGVGVNTNVDTCGYKDITTYGRDPNATMDLILNKYLKRKLLLNLQPASIIFFGFNYLGQHLGILLDDTNFFYHAFQPEKKVVITRYDSRWQARTRGIYDYYGLED